MSCKAISHHLIEVGLNDGLLCNVIASNKPIVLLTDAYHMTARHSSRQSLVADTAVKVNKLRKYFRTFGFYTCPLLQNH